MPGKVTLPPRPLCEERCKGANRLEHRGIHLHAKGGLDEQIVASCSNVYKNVCK